MNKVILSGRLANAPELKTTESGLAICTFTLAVRRTEEKTDFIICKAWSNCAQYISDHCAKGQSLLVDGALTVNKWVKNDGSTAFQYSVNVNRVESMSVKPQNGA